MFDVGDPISAPSRGAAFVIRREADLDIAARRRANYVTLPGELRDLVAPSFSEFPQGASPLQRFRLRSDEKSVVLERLAAAGVEGADMWPRDHPAVEARQSEQARELEQNSWDCRFIICSRRIRALAGSPTPLAPPSRYCD
jgi:hypothetical protein